MAKNCVHLTEGIDVSGGTTANTASISPAANSAVVIAIFAYDCNSMSVSGLGLSWTAAINGAVIGTGGFGSGRLWVFVGAGASPSTGSITLTFPTDSFVNWTVDNITGTVNLATPTNSNVITGTAATGTTLSATLGAFANAANGTWACGIAHDAVNVTAGSGFSLVDSNVGTAMFGWTDFSEFRDSNDTSPDATIDSSTEWSFAAIEILEAGGGGGTVNTQTLSDTVTLADPAVLSTARGCVVADSVVATDGANLFYRRMREILSNIVISEGSTDFILNINVEATSEVLLSDDFVAWFRRTRLAQDSVTVTDELISSLIGYLIFTSVLTSNVSVTDQALRTANFYRLMESSIVTADQILRAVLVARDLLDGIEITDSGLTAAQRFILLTDAISLEDALTALYIPDTGPIVDNPIIRIGFDQPEIAIGGYGLN